MRLPLCGLVGCTMFYIHNGCGGDLRDAPDGSYEERFAAALSCVYDVKGGLTCWSESADVIWACWDNYFLSMVLECPDTPGVVDGTYWTAAIGKNGGCTAYYWDGDRNLVEDSDSPPSRMFIAQAGEMMSTLKISRDSGGSCVQRIEVELLNLSFVDEEDEGFVVDSVRRGPLEVLESIE